MRLMVVNSRLAERGGADRWMLGLLARVGPVAPTLLAVGYVDRQLPDAERARVGPFVVIRGLDRAGLGKRHLRGAMDGLQGEVDRFRPTVIQVNDIIDPAILNRIASTGRGVMMVQDHRFFCPGRGKVDILGKPCARAMGEACLACLGDPVYGRTMMDLTRRRLEALSPMARVTVLSNYMAQELARLGVERVSVIPPFVDGLAAGPRPGPGRYHLLAGRLTEHKGVRVALEAARHLQVPMPLIVAGQGSLAEEVAAEARARGEMLQYVGWAGRGPMEDLLAQARTLWLPSLWAEPFGIVGLEALAAGVPVVASRVGGVEDWLAHERQGLLVRPGSPHELARAADRLAGDGALAGELGRRGRRRAWRDYHPSRAMERLLNLYRELS